MTVEFSTENFQANVLAAQVPVLVDFYTATCGPCQRLVGVIDELASDNEGKAIVGKVDAYENSELSLKYTVNAVPTILLFKNGEVVERHVGF